MTSCLGAGSLLLVLLHLFPVIEGGKSMSESYGSIELDQLLSNISYVPPNLYFIGVSKGGTTSMINILTRHPLIVGIGSSKKGIPAGESHILKSKEFENIEEMKQEESLRLHHNLNYKHGQDVIQKGIIVHYTPHYIIDPSIGETICKILNSENKVCRQTKLFVMLREPTSRAISSWWYKSGCYKHACHPLASHIPDGFQKIRDLEKCMTDEGFSIKEVSSGYLSAGSRLTKRMDRCLDQCPLKLLLPNVSRSMYSSHFGKSMYAHQLVRWYQQFDARNLYLMTLENFVREPLREMDLFLRWLGVPTYGSDGFASPESLLNATRVKYNVHEIPRNIIEKQVEPVKAEIEAFFQPSIRDLFALLRPIASDKQPLKPLPHQVSWSDVSELIHTINVKMVEKEESKRTSFSKSRISRS